MVLLSSQSHSTPPRPRKRLRRPGGDEGHRDNDQRPEIENRRLGISSQAARVFRRLARKEFGRRQLFAYSSGRRRESDCSSFVRFHWQCLARNNGFVLRNSPFPPLTSSLLSSSLLSFVRLPQGDVWRVSPDTGWVKQLYLFLFDKQVIYCKKELLKNRYIYKGRIKLDEVTNRRRVRSMCPTVHPLSVVRFALSNGDFFLIFAQ